MFAMLFIYSALRGRIGGSVTSTPPPPSCTLPFTLASRPYTVTLQNPSIPEPVGGTYWVTC